MDTGTIGTGTSIAPAATQGMSRGKKIFILLLISILGSAAVGTLIYYFVQQEKLTLERKVGKQITFNS